MAKILVADDNSNIQKMVGLALKDQGIDVVAVGNGEAAVRKISDVHPDLVLADVFMPVRNGYEVCKYVKDDSSLSHIPVILLVGAFDPLDEQEAQRVGADGVLKKPFVPPDPLISMVKSALARAGVAYSGAAPGKENGSEAVRATEAVAPPPKPSVPLGGALPEEPMPEPVSKRPPPLTIESTSQPLAFGSLLETPEIKEEEEDDSAFVTAPSSDLVPERSWGAEEEEEEIEEEEESPKSSWRRSGAEEFEEAPTAGKTDWREAAFGKPEPVKRHSEPWAPTKEKTGFVEAEEPAPVVPTIPEPSARDISIPPSWASSIVRAEAEAVSGKVEERPAEKELPSIPAPSFPAPPFREEATMIEAPAAESRVTEAPPFEAPKTTAPAAAPPSSSASSWFSVASSPWEAEVQKAGQLAATWDTGIGGKQQEAPAESHAPAPAEPDIAEPVSELIASPEPEAAQPEPEVHAVTHYLPTDPELEPPTTEAIREETAQAVEEVIQEQEASPAAPEPVSEPAAPESSLDDVVAKVLAKMSPEVLQAVTREILKPVVEAMVRDELNKK